MTWRAAERAAVDGRTLTLSEMLYHLPCVGFKVASSRGRMFVYPREIITISWLKERVGITLPI